MSLNKMYFHDAASGVSGTLPSGEHSAQSSSVAVTGSGTARTMDGTISVSAQTSIQWSTLANTSAQRTFARLFCTPPLAAQRIQAQNWTVSLAGAEQNGNSNFKPSGVIYAWRPSTGAVVGSVLSDLVAGATEVNTTQTARTVTLAGTAVDILDGDILVCELWREATVQATSTSYTNTLYYDGTTEASTTSCASFLQGTYPVYLQGERGPTFDMVSGFPMGAGAGANNTTTINIPTAGVGDELYLIVGIASASITMSGASSSRTSGWARVKQFVDSTNTWTLELWKARVDSTGTHTVTVTYSGSVATVVTEIDAMCFHSSRSSPVWWSSVQGGQHDGSGTSYNLPTLTPSIDGPQAYIGLGSPTQQANGGSTAGYIYNNLDTNWVTSAYYIGVVGAQTPVLAQTPSGTGTVIAAIISDAPIDGSGSCGMKKPSISISATVSQTLAAPTFVASYDTTDWTTNTTPKTHSVTTAAGDYLAIPGISEDNTTVLDTPTGGSLSYHLEQSVVVTDYDWLGIWTTKDASGQSYTLSQTRSGGSTERWGNQALRFSGATGIGASAKTNSTSGGPSLSITTKYDHSAIVIAVGDWNGVDGASRVWRTVNGYTPTAGNGLETHYYRSPIPATGYIAYIPDAGTAGAKTVGLSTPSASMQWDIIAVEIVGHNAPSSDTGTGSLALKKPALSLSGTEKISGTGSCALKKPALSLAGKPRYLLSGSAAVKKPSLSLSGTEKFIGTGSAAMKKPALSLAADEEIPGTGSLAIKKPAISILAIFPIIGTGSAGIKKPSLSGAGTPKYLISGSAAIKKPALSGSGSEREAGTGSAAIKKPSLSGVGTPKYSGTGSLAVKKPAIQGSGGFPNIGTGSVGMKKPALSGTGGSILRNNSEAQSSGTTVTTGNAGSTGNAGFDAIQIAANGGSLTFDNTHAAHGTRAFKFVTGSPNGNSIVEWTTAFTVSGGRLTAYMRSYFYITANPGSTLRAMRALNGSTLRGCIGINSSGKIVVLDASGTARGTSTAAIPLNQWFRVEGFVTGDASAGQVEAKLYSTADAISPTETVTSASNLNTGGVINRVDFGNPTSVTSYTHWQDDLGASPYGYMGPAGIAGTGSCALKKPSLSGVGTPKYLISGSAAMKKPSLSVSGSERESGTGSAAIKKPSLSLAGTPKYIATGGVSLHKPSIQLGTPNAATGGLSLHKMSISAAGRETITGTGSAGLKKPSVQVSGKESEAATGGVSLHKPGISGSGTVSYHSTGTGSIAIKKPQLSLDSSETIFGSGGVSMKKPRITAFQDSQPSSSLFVFAPV